MKLIELLESTKDKDAIVTRSKFNSSWHYYADAKGSPLKMLDGKQRSYTSSSADYVYWNPQQKDLLADDWYLVREGKPKGIGTNLGNGIVTIPNKNSLPKSDMADKKDRKGGLKTKVVLNVKTTKRC